MRVMLPELVTYIYIPVRPLFTRQLNETLPREVQLSGKLLGTTDKDLPIIL